MLTGRRCWQRCDQGLNIDYYYCPGANDGGQPCLCVANVRSHFDLLYEYKRAGFKRSHDSRRSHAGRERHLAGGTCVPFYLLRARLCGAYGHVVI